MNDYLPYPRPTKFSRGFRLAVRLRAKEAQDMADAKQTSKPKYMIVRIDDPSVFVGLQYGDAVQRIGSHGYTPLLVRSNKISREFIRDYDPLRVLLTTENEIVVLAKIG